ncbi:GH92 family glycosyl hydrolase [Bacteroides sp.]|uniref:GH92 family glycosyl hydrolase n=1 Tax=Bacteroides sp. TaxID=29523 RepID=UPI001B57F54E|nr:GH92 family glycosyl hydrolase [Bacteroides sp.]MBP6065705.1 GH92 family glycosyl hydrolase [Bacteroides sp.]MBP6067978.1 GH92 family glycosyl hydrolase [Bacteroides sp.]MBP6936769.1 GH92 family glycosyl hydrolase [Bacteroides sp.]MBP8622452.1 GH92 family glycosyl hydrolase [Bacteroides sp.]MBP9586059.1 GH92 family glycosyl hydrolase [Bacteroides sp.]
MKLISTLLGCSLLLGTVSCSQQSTTPDYTAYVNPFIGTGGHGHTFPGAIVPNGMIQPSPDTRIYDWDACSGYHYSDSTINGFSHTHLSGTGCGDYGDVLLMPTVGKQETHSMGSKSQQMAYASAFSHQNEVAVPGYYSVQLDRYGVKAELTATKRGALHRYTFPESKEAGFILDFDYSLQRQTNKEMVIEVISDTEIRGRKKTMYWAFDQYINFYAKFSKPFTYTLLTDSMALDEGGKLLPTAKVLLNFNTKAGEEVLVKVGISAVDMEGAKGNVEAEIPEWDFEGVRQQAKKSWNDYLSKIDIETTNEDQKTIFYTALYHTGVQPNLFTDVDGRYLGMDLNVHQGDVNKPIYTVFSLWDTFRAYHPLMTIIDPELNQAFIRSLIQKQQEGGVFPMWELAGNYTGTMIGYHAVSVIADAYMKGYRDFDVDAAYKASLRVAEYDTTGIKCPALVLPHLMPQAKYWKNKIGYVPCDKDNEAVAKALEYAYNDWCISILADSLGDVQNRDKYAKFAEGYKTYFDPSTRFMRGLDSKGEWRTPFSPRASTHRNDDYCEGTAWQWTWFVPHQVDGLVALMGGREGFISKLDSLFTADSTLEGEATSADISGLIGQYAHGNEPSHHITHLYNYVDQPWKTQQLVDSVLQTLYFNDPDGISGNEDCGQMSAWYILNSMGFYQVAPGKPVYSIGRPLFDKVTVNLKAGKKFTVIAKNNSRANKYIQSMMLNGKPLDKPFFTHRDIVDGGTLEFVMGSTPPANSIKQ